MNRLLLIGTIIGLAGLLWFASMAGPAEKPPAAPVKTQAVKAAQPEPVKTPPPPGVPVLMYHKIGEEKNNDAVISAARFTEHMEYLHSNGYQPLSFSELDAYLGGRQDLPAKPVVITFDDGYRDSYEIAMPILKRYGFKSIVFIIAGEERHLTWEEIRAMKAAGMDIGSHSFLHRDLGAMTPAEQARQIAQAKETIDRNLGQDTRWFCYPNGSYDQETLRLLSEQGFTIAVTIEPGWVKRGDNPLTLKRVWMGNAVDIRNFELRLTREDYPPL